ncbi:MAG: EAL domain-containing protein [Cyanobacteria bacterium J06621_11]
MTFKILRRWVCHQTASVQNYLLERRYNKSRDGSLIKAITLSSATTGCLLAFAQMGFFQSAEVKSFDLLTQLTARYDRLTHKDAEIDSPVVVVAITESDIQQQNRWPFSDQIFADLLAQLQLSEPQVVGLDVYRDIPHHPGTRALENQLQEENVVVVTHLDSLGGTKVPSPFQISQERVGFSDFVVDPDGVVRRNFMFAAIGERQLYSLSLRLVENFLAAQDKTISAELDALQLGNKRVSRLTQNVGGYQSIDTGGYQSLGRYYAPNQVARELSVAQVLSGDYDPDWIRGKIVLIGTIAPSQKDLFYTPFSFGNGESLVTSGVALHAQMVRQLLGIVSEDRLQLFFLPQWGEFIWVLFWGVSAGVLIWRFTHPLVVMIATIVSILSLLLITLILFSYSVWVPVVLPLSAFCFALTSLIVYREFYKSFYDAITGLPNRNSIIQELQKLLKSQKNSSVAVVLLDIDRFKVFNESFGLKAGDRLLQIMAMRVRASLSPCSKLARIAGDEFVVLLKDVVQKEEVLIFAEQLSQKITEPIEFREQRLFPTASIGIAFSRQSDASDAWVPNAENLLRDAQTAMSRAKAQGRGNCEVFAEDMRSHLSHQLGLEADLRVALARQEMVLHYQPLICLNSMKLAGFEALIRWQHPTRGMISPGEFIPIAEDTGLIVPIGQWVLETAIAQAQQWQQQSPEHPPFISVNLSGRQFAQKDLVKQIARILQETQFNPPDLKLELTESVVMDDVEASIDVLLQLKSLGLQLGIDDFGTGYSSLSYLHRFPIDTLKVDRSFVMDMETPGGTAELVKTIIALGHNLGMNVVAEGIETHSQSQKLQDLQCEYGQGYLFSRPLPVGEASTLLNKVFKGMISQML